MDTNLDHYERLVKVETKIEMIEPDLKEMRDDIKAIRSTLDQAKGGWKTLMAVSGLASAIGGTVGWMISHFKLF